MAVLLGKSILKNWREGWTSAELRTALKTSSIAVNSGKSRRGVEISDLQPGQVGVSKSKSRMISADYRIVWARPPSNADGEAGKSRASASGDAKALIIERPAISDPNALRGTYEKALRNAVAQNNAGHIVIAPISDTANNRDGGHSDTRTCSDNNIRCLLSAIDTVKRENPKCKVTIAVGDHADKNLSQRIVDIQIRRKEEQRGMAASGRSAMPASARRFVMERTTSRVKSLDEKKLEIRKTSLKNVSVCCAESIFLKAEVAILSYYSVNDLNIHMRRNGFNELPEIFEQLDTSGSLHKEAQSILKESDDRWKVRAIEIPPCELPYARLFCRAPSSKGTSADDFKQYFLDHLKGQRGRVVINLSVDPNENAGLLEALREISAQPDPQCEIIVIDNYEARVQAFEQMTNAKESSESDLGSVNNQADA